MQLSLIIPIYKQEKTIVDNVKHILKALEKTRFSYEVICVVDGHVDHSYELLKKEHLLFTHVLGYEKNNGKSWLSNSEPRFRGSVARKSKGFNQPNGAHASTRTKRLCISETGLPDR